MDNLLLVLNLAAILGCGLMGGVFFAFSTFVMRALAQLQPARGLEAMQAINRTVLNPWFLGVFLGTAALSLLLIGLALWRDQQAGATYLLAGGLLYMLGTLLVTIVGNVPMNEALAKIESDSDEAADHWAHYLARWTTWNHVRTAASLAACASFALRLG
ncbi:MAG: DUF1772 domain-containing protein [Candidatus Latescibacteria bacterium]|nr:DUF1772 domain-containing protein [Candidatus Latescibacterota bacterium]